MKSAREPVLGSFLIPLICDHGKQAYLRKNSAGEVSVSGPVGGR